MPAPARGRGRPRKYETKEERLAAEAAQKKGARHAAAQDEAIKRAISKNRDLKGGAKEVSGGNNATRMSEITDVMEAASNTDPDDPDRRWEVPDRRHAAVTPNPDDDDTTSSEKDETHLNAATRKQARAIKNWKAGKRPTPCTREEHEEILESGRYHQDASGQKWCTVCDFLLVNSKGELVIPTSKAAAPRQCRRGQDHQRLADSHHDSTRKVYCAECGKLLVSPGKTVRGITPYVPPPPIKLDTEVNTVTSVESAA